MRLQNVVFAFLILAAGYGLALFTLPHKAEAEAKNATALSDMQKAEIRQLFKEYLRESGGEIMESVTMYQEKQQREAQQMAQQKIPAMMDKLAGANAPSAGNPKGDVTIVEFFDYNCGYCKKAMPDLIELLKEDKNVRLVFKDMPILGPTSITAAQWALASHKQGKYFEFHQAVMEHQGPKTEEELTKIAEKLGLDVKKMKEDAASDEVSSTIAADMKASAEIGIRGTPAFIIGDQFFPGYIGKDGLLDAIKKHRADKKG